MASPAFRNRARNPYNWLLYSAMEDFGVQVQELSERRLLAGDADVWHLHWPEHMVNGPLRPALIRMVRFAAALVVARARGTAVFYTVHNLAGHDSDRPRLERLQRWLVVRGVRATIHLSEQARAMALDRYPALRRKPSFVVPHGHYRDVYPNHVAPEEARASLGLAGSEVVLGYVGLIRPYKGVNDLVGAFRRVDDDRLILLLAGKPEPPSQLSSLEAMIDSDRRIRSFLGFVPDDDLQRYFAACDLVVLPFRKVLNSGSALLALSFDRPILVPDTGGFSELRELIGPEWLHMYEGELTPHTLEETVQRLGDRQAVQPDLSALDWPVLARATIQAYEEVLGRRVTIAAD